MKDGFDDALNNERAQRHHKRFREKREFSFPWTNLGPAFSDGTYRCHFLAHAVKCPNAFHLYSTHAIEIDPGRDPKKVLCTETYDKNLECYCCALMDICDDDDVWPYLGEELQDVLSQLKARRTFLFPISIYARRISQGKEGPNWEPHETEETGMLLAVSQDTVLKRIKALRTRYPTMADKGPEGRYVWLTKDGRNYSLDADEDKSILNNLDLMGDQYPKVKEFGFKDKKLSSERVEAMIRGSWWGKKLGEFVDLDG